jgi:hypothetical protein
MHDDHDQARSRLSSSKPLATLQTTNKSSHFDIPNHLAFRECAIDPCPDHNFVDDSSLRTQLVHRMLLVVEISSSSDHVMDPSAASANAFQQKVIRDEWRIVRGSLEQWFVAYKRQNLELSFLDSFGHNKPPRPESKGNVHSKSDQNRPEDSCSNKGVKDVSTSVLRIDASRESEKPAFRDRSSPMSNADQTYRGALHSSSFSTLPVNSKLLSKQRKNEEWRIELSTIAPRSPSPSNSQEQQLIQKRFKTDQQWQELHL